MSEFKFPCPQCKQHIQCDASYVGMQIDCPACGKSVVVPPAPSMAGAPPKGTIQIKTSTLRMAAMVVLGLLLLAGAVDLALYFTAPKKLTFKAYVDGTDIIKICGSRLWIEHQDFQLPTRIKVNGVKWDPAWNGETSATYKLRRGLGGALRLTKQQGRGDISILEKPGPNNNQTLAIKLDDGQFGGADWYEFTLSW